MVGRDRSTTAVPAVAIMPQMVDLDGDKDQAMTGIIEGIETIAPVLASRMVMIPVLASMLVWRGTHREARAIRSATDKETPTSTLQDATTIDLGKEGMPAT